jgi:hypothetical protein
LVVPVVAGLLLILYVALAAVYWQQRSQQGPILDQLTQLSRVVNRPREGLEGLKVQVIEARALIPQDLKETDVYPAIRALAAENGVVVKSQTVGKETQDKTGDTVYRVIPFSIQVGGEGVTYQQVVDFIANLETQHRLPTLVIDSAAISQSEGTASASIDFRVYVQPEAKPAPTPKPG